ncbi:MAG: hypothetical protein HY430_03610 [Candidatus Levybacteria bacterium]|nr:hypothetical protein [Candidatus Levybacteria bacterium]
MKQFGAIGEALENVEKNVKQAVKQGVKQQVKAIAQSAKGQFTTSGQAQAADGGSGTNEAAQQSFGAAQDANAHSDQATKDFVNELYAPSNNNQQLTNNSQQGGNKQPSQFVQNQVKSGKTPEEAQQLEALRKRLHDETYYIPLTRRKPQEQEQQEEQQKKEEEKMEQLQVEDKKKQKDQPIAVQMGQQHAEKYPGASG